MQDRALKDIFRRYSLLLVTVLAVRALIPVGYMLSFPADGQAGFALHLCPGQNPHLDLNALDDAERLEEIARMLSGANVTEEARAAARRLVQGSDAA